MSKISGQKNINIGLPNEAANSDSLYTAFNKIQDNFNTLFNNASNVVASVSDGIEVTNNAANTVLKTKLVAGDSIALANTANGIQISAVTERYLSSSTTSLDITTGTKTLTIGTDLSYIPAQSVIVAFNASNYMIGSVTSYNRTTGSLVFNCTTLGGGGIYSSWTVNLNGAAGGTGGGTITAVTAGTGLTGGGNAGAVTLSLATSGVTAGTYTNPTFAVDSLGRVTSASNNSVSGTVTSVGLSAGSGIQIGGGPITTSGIMSVTNTGVTRITAGTNVTVTQETGEVRIDAASFNGVTSILLTSSTLNISPSTAQTSAASISVDIPANVAVTGRLNLSGSEDLASGAAASLNVTATYFTTGASGETGTLAAGTSGLIKTFMMSGDGGGDMVITVTNAAWGGAGTMTFADVGDGCTLQYINSKWFCVGNNGVVFA